MEPCRPPLAARFVLEWQVDVYLEETMRLG